MSATTGELRQQMEVGNTRRHDLDALRAFAMLLGIALHAALSFMDFPWVVQDQSREPALGGLVAAIHGFRMPLFFLLSGFFTAMLWRRRGLRGLLWHRAKRIALPLALGCVTIVPLMWVVVGWAGSAGATSVVADTGKDIWTAAAHGNLDAVRAHIEEGVPLDAVEPATGQSVLGWAALGDQQEVVDYLLSAGADPNARYVEENTALHSAAFFGRDGAAGALLAAGADVTAKNVHGETPVDSMRHDRATTEFIAGLLKMPIDFNAVAAGRDRIRTMLESSGEPSLVSAGAPGNSAEEGGASTMQRWLGTLLFGEFFFHLWFLWHLCWLVAGFALVVFVLGKLPQLRVPRVLIATPLCLLWLAPLTALTQSFMHQNGTMPGFGADTSGALVPALHVLAHYAIFFGFGALVFGAAGAVDRLGRRWGVHLTLASLAFPAAVTLAVNIPLGRELVGSEGGRHLLASLGQALYVWLMVFGLMGLFQKLLRRERRWVRFASDSSYWLYLVHLPLVIAGQVLLRDVGLPAMVKLVALIVGTTAILLVSYRGMVRYTWIGRLLNGPRVKGTLDRPATEEMTREEPAASIAR